MPLKIHPSLLRSDAEPMSKQSRAALGSDMLPMLSERRLAMRDMQSNVLMGATAICRYMRISAIRTLQRWVDGYGFPAIKTPDGKWLTTTTAIDEWIWLASELEAANKLSAKQRQVLATISGNGHIHEGDTYTSSHVERGRRQGMTDGEMAILTAGKRIMKGYDVV